MFTQLSLFEEEPTDLFYRFDVVEVDENFKSLTYVANIDGKSVKGIIKNSFEKRLSERELLNLMKEALKIEIGTYGYHVYYTENDRHFRLYTRFFNETTSKNESPREFIREGYRTWGKERLNAINIR